MFKRKYTAPDLDHESLLLEAEMVVDHVKSLVSEAAALYQAAHETGHNEADHDLDTARLFAASAAAKRTSANGAQEALNALPSL